MGKISLKKGLDLPILGEPKQQIDAAKQVKSVALLGNDYVGMKPTMAVAVGDQVKLGQVLFTDKKMPSVKYTSPGTGKIVAINRGEKRAFKSIVVELEGDEEITFPSFSNDKIKDLKREQIVTQLVDSGQWTVLRSRPFSKVADPAAVPHSIFITAMDTNPLAPSVETILKGQEELFITGTTILSKLTDGKLYLCKLPNTKIPQADLNALSVHEFQGPHPAGNVGTHIHFLDPVGRNKTVWYINAQDVVAWQFCLQPVKFPSKGSFLWQARL